MKLTDAVSLGQPDSRPLARGRDADGAHVVPENRKSLRCTTGSDATTHVPPPQTQVLQCVGSIDR